MANIKGTFGPITIGDEKINAGMNRKSMQRSPNDPLNFIKIDSKIPKENKYSVGSTDVFNFGEQLDKIHITKYT